MGVRPQDVVVPAGWLSRGGRNRDLAAECVGVKITNTEMTLVYQARVEVDGTYTHLWMGGRKKALAKPAPAIKGDLLTATWFGHIRFDEDNSPI